MKRTSSTLALRPSRSILAILIAVTALVNPVSATECIDGLSETLFNTTSNCSSEPAIDRIFGTQIMYWGGSPMLVGNVGNDLSIWNIQNNQNPVKVSESRFRVGNVGDSDYDMYNFSVCDDCRYGVANYKKGTVLFDMGTGGQPDFGEKTINWDADLTPGALTFKHDGQQYLIASTLIDACTDGNSTLYKYNGINEETDLSFVGCVDTGGAATMIVGGYYVDGYLYLGDKSQRVFVFEVQTWGSTIALNYISQPMLSYMIKDKGLAIDFEHMIAIEARSTGMHVWDISNPGSPIKKSTVAGSYDRAAVKWPLVFVARKGWKQSEKTFDISNLSSPQPLDQDFWSASNAWNYPDHQCAEIQGATFSPDGSTLYLSRYSVLQMADFAACGGPISPTAKVAVTPDPVFPGNTVYASNQSLGEVDRSAIWVTLGPDPLGVIVAGEATLSATTPASRSFVIPRDVTYDTAYYAHVAVESNEFPYGGASTPDQIETKMVNIDRNPDVSFALFPGSPITGDQVSLTVSAEGNPANPSGGEVYEWVITPPVTTPYTDSGSPITIDLNESGSWTIELVVHYEHTISKLGEPEIYDATATEVLDISSVFANFTYSPSEPVNTEALFLDATSSSVAAGASPSYSWQITGPTNYSGCASGPTASTCTIPADSLIDGYYDFSMTLTNTDNSDSSTKTYTNVRVADGNVNLDFTWSPASPDIGDAITFRVEGVNEDLNSASWNFGGGSCSGSGFTSPVTCTPDGLYLDCTLQPYNYSSSGTKSVSLTVNVAGNTYGPVQKSVSIGSAGSCDSGGGTTCSYGINPSTSTHAATGGAGSISVSTQTGCAWTASSTYGWITITSGSNGNGSGTVQFTVAANTGEERSGTIRAAGINHFVTQAGAACSYTLAAYEASFDAGGGTGSVQVVSASGCQWTATAHAGWISVTSGGTGTGTGYVHFEVATNPYPSERVGTISIAGNTFTIVEGPNVPTNFSISKSNPEIGEKVTFTVDAGLTPVSWNLGESNCYGDSAFIDCTTRPSGYCNSIEWGYPTSGTNAITLITTTGDKTKQVTVQNAGECCIADDEPDASFKMNPDPALVGETVTFTDTSGDAKRAAAKAAINAVNFTWDPTTPEIGELVELHVSGVGTIDSAKWEFHEAGCSGFDATYVCTPLYTDCMTGSFKFASSGEKTVTLTVVVNGSTWAPLSRTITVLASGTCAGGGGCSYSIDPNVASYPEGGGSGTIAVTTQAGCAWSASSNQGWATITSGASGSGSGSVSYTVSANTGAYRTGTIRAANKNHSVTQAGSGGGGCSYSLSSGSANFAANGGLGSFVVTTQAGCTWTASSSQGWVAITSGSSGSGIGTVVYSVGVNTGLARSAFVTAGGNTHVVNQAEQIGGGGNTDPTEWSWTISKAGTTVVTSDEQEFTYVFTQPGLYDVELVAGNCKGETSDVQTIEIDRPPIPIPDDYLVPAAIHAPGLNDTLWKTDLRLFNPGNEPVTANIEYLPEGINNNGTVLLGVTIDLDNKATWVHDDIVERFPVLVDDAAKGSLKITFEDELGGQPLIAPIIMSRTYNEASEGTFGQYVPAVPVIPLEESEIYLTGLIENYQYRTNIGLANMGPEDEWVLLTLFDKDGDEIGDMQRMVPGYSTDQVVKVAVIAGIQTALNIYSVRIDTDGADISAYASVIDNVTGDPVLYTSYRLDDDIVYVPGLAHLPGVNDSSWRSDMTFFNPTGAPLDVHVDYVPSEDTPEAPWMEFPSMYDLSAYYFNDILGYLLGQSAESKGYFIVSGIDGSLVPQIAGRTYSQDATSGTFGQSLKTFCSKDLVAVGQSAFIAGVSNSSDSAVGFRTNLGLLNIEPYQWSEVSIILYNESGGVEAQIERTLKQAEFTQFNLFKELGIEDLDITGSVEITVLANGPVAIYASHIDNQTQDPILIPAQIVAIE